MTRMCSRALHAVALALVLLFGGVVPATAAVFGPPDFTWTVDADGLGSFDACASNGGVVDFIDQYHWMIQRLTEPGPSDRVYEEVIHRDHTGGASVCDDFRYRFPVTGIYRVRLGMTVATGEEEWVIHDVTVTLPLADLGVEAAAGDPTAVAGAPVTFTVTLTNHGPDAASGVWLGSQPMPGGTGGAWDVADAGGMACSTGADWRWSCAVGSIGAGKTRVVRLSGSLPGPGTLSLHAAASSDTADPEPGNDGADASATVVVNDQEPPVVTGVPGREPDAGGWYVRNVRIDWQSSDPEPSSGTPSDPPDTIASTEGADVRFTSDQSCDPAGHCAKGSVVLSIDKTPPVVSCPRRAPNFSLGEAGARVSAEVSDAHSGPVDATVGADVDTGSVGAKSVELTGRDRAGHETTVTCSFSVGYVFDGFLPPLKGDGALNRVRAGRVIPFRWRLTDAAGNPVRGLTDVTLTAVDTACQREEMRGRARQGTRDRRHRPDHDRWPMLLVEVGRGHYLLLWKSPRSYADSCKVVSLDLGEGRGHTALFKFR